MCFILAEYMYVYLCFASGQGDRVPIRGQVIPKTQKNGMWYHLV